MSFDLLEKKFLLFLSAYLFFIHLFCIVDFLNFFEAKPHCNELLALPCEIIFEINQSLAFVRQPTRIGHVWRIIIAHNTLVTTPLLIYNKHMVHENNPPPPFKVIERYHKK